MTAIAHLMDVTLSHDARLTAAADSGHVVVLSSDGAASLISPDFKTVKTFTVPEDPQAAALSHDASLLAVAAADGITLLSIPAFEKSHRLNDAFLSCLFVGEKLFWTCARLRNKPSSSKPGSPAHGPRSRVSRLRIRMAIPSSHSSHIRTGTQWLFGPRQVRMVSVSSGLPSAALR